jgi:hypothetical protein
MYPPPLEEPLEEPLLDPLDPLELPLELPLDEPLDPLDPPHGPQIPCVLPGGRTHDVPGQQSALLVQPPHAGMHCMPEHTYGGIPPGLGTQGNPPQQFALDAHAAPASTHAPEQRGTPTLS